jgi:hypothetical protein
MALLLSTSPIRWLRARHIEREERIQFVAAESEERVLRHEVLPPTDRLCLVVLPDADRQ